MVRHWPCNNDYDVLFTFSKSRKVESLFTCDFVGVRYDKHNDVNKDTYQLLGPYVISNWSDEE